MAGLITVNGDCVGLYFSLDDADRMMDKICANLWYVHDQRNSAFLVQILERKNREVIRSQFIGEESKAEGCTACILKQMDPRDCNCTEYEECCAHGNHQHSDAEE